MKMLQIFTKEDTLRKYKLQKGLSYGKVYFFEDQVNGVIDMSSGSVNNIHVSEKIYTDGNISLNKINKYAPSVVWNEQFQTLDEGSSIAIEIMGATYMVCAIKYGSQTAYEIHVTEESKELYDQILAYLFNHNHTINPNLIFFTPANDIILDSNKQKVLLNLKTGKERIIR